MMKLPLFKNYSIGLLLFVSTSILGVQTLEAKKKISFDYQCIALNQDFRRLDIFADAPKVGRQRIRLGDLSKSPVGQYKGKPLVSFYDKAKGGTVLAAIKIDPSLQSPLFIFGPGKENESSPYSVFTIENDWSVHGANTCLLLNLSSKVLYYKEGDNRIELPANSEDVIRLEVAEGEALSVLLEAEADGKTSRVYRAKWHPKPNLRRLVIIRDAAANELGLVRVKVVEDFERKKPVVPQQDNDE
jgi:hypothetical protein